MSAEPEHPVHVYQCGRTWVRCVLVGLLGLMALSQWIRRDAGLGYGLALSLTALAVFNGYVWLYRVATELRLHGGFLEARSPLIDRVASVDAIIAMRPFSLDGSLEVIEINGAPPLLVSVGQALPEFGARLARENPATTVSITAPERIMRRQRRSSYAVFTADLRAGE